MNENEGGGFTIHEEGPAPEGGGVIVLIFGLVFGMAWGVLICWAVMRFFG